MIKKLTVKETNKERTQVEERKANIGGLCGIGGAICDYIWGPSGLHYAGLFIAY